MLVLQIIMVEELTHHETEAGIDAKSKIQNLEMQIMGRTTVEALFVPGWNIWQEKYKSDKSNLSGVVAHFGRRVTRVQMDGIVQKFIDANPQRSVEEKWVGPLDYSAGFGAIYKAPEDSTREEKDAAVFEVALKLVKDALELKGWKPGEVDIVDFANSAAVNGMSAILNERLISELGMREDIGMTGTFMACDGAGNALYRRLKDQESVGKKVLLLTVDSVGTELPLDPNHTDTNSMQLFSNGAAALTYIPGVDIRLLVGNTEVHEDTNGALAAVARYNDAIKGDESLDPEEPTGLVRKIGNERMIQMPYPDNGGFLMNGSATAKFFLRNSLANVKSTIADYKEKFIDRMPNKTTSHEPSAKVLDGVEHALAKAGINLNIRRSVPDGNSSGATSLISFNRQMQEFNPGDHVFYISYGAGGSFTSFVVEVGNKAS